MNPTDPEWKSPFNRTETESVDDLAPDAHEPGDNELPEELADLVHDGDIVPDNVDKEEVESDGA